MNTELQTSSGPVIHLICGSTGAGKSTYAKMLSNDIGAIYFSIDDWMTALFGPDVDNVMDWKWISERVLRCENQMISTACALAETGVSSILEIGLQQASKREKVTSVVAKKSGCTLQTHFLDIDAAERWRRVEQRNTEKGETFKLEVTRDMFDFFEAMWEPPSEQELLSFKRVQAIKGSNT
ncbi:MAG: AAA family ATPase [Oceanicoccus sp.]